MKASCLSERREDRKKRKGKSVRGTLLLFFSPSCVFVTVRVTLPRLLFPKKKRDGTHWIIYPIFPFLFFFIFGILICTHLYFLTFVFFFFVERPK